MAGFLRPARPIGRIREGSGGGGHPAAPDRRQPGPARLRGGTRSARRPQPPQPTPERGGGESRPHRACRGPAAAGDRTSSTAAGELERLPDGLRETAAQRRHQPDADLDTLASALGSEPLGGEPPPAAAGGAGRRAAAGSPTEWPAPRVPLVAGNWKMHPTSRSAAVLLAHDVAAATAGLPVRTVVCPPAVFLEAVATGAGRRDDRAGRRRHRCPDHARGRVRGLHRRDLATDAGRPRAIRDPWPLRAAPVRQRDRCGRRGQGRLRGRPRAGAHRRHRRARGRAAERRDRGGHRPAAARCHLAARSVWPGAAW